MRNLSRVTRLYQLINQLRLLMVLIIFLGEWLGGNFFLTPPVQAVTPDLVITEIMYNLEGTDDLHEWVEFYNRGNKNITLVGGRSPGGWRFFDGSNHFLNIETIIITPGQYFILADDSQAFLADHPGFSGVVIETVMDLKNTSATLKLIDGEGNEVTKITYQNSWGGDGNGKSLEKIDLAGSDDLSNWGESLVIGGTPGKVNSISEKPKTLQPTKEPQLEPESLSSEEKSKPIIYPSENIAPAQKTEETEKAEPFEKRLAAISEPLRQAQGGQIPKFLSIFLIALTIAIFSGIIILILKKKLKKLLYQKN